MSDIVLHLRYAPSDAPLAEALWRESKNVSGVSVTTSDAATSPDTSGILALLNPANLARDADLYALLYQTRGKGQAVIALITDDPTTFDTNYVLPSLVDMVFTNDANTRLYYHSHRVRHLPPAVSDAPLSDTPSSSPNSPDVLIVAESSEAALSLISAVKAALSPGAVCEVVSEAETLSWATEARVVIRYSRFVPGDANRMFEIIPSTPDALTFTLAARHVCQLVFLRQPDILDYFPPETLPTFDTPASLTETLHPLLADEAAYREIGARAYEHVMANHLWRHRLAAIADAIRVEGLAS